MPHCWHSLVARDCYYEASYFVLSLANEYLLSIKMPAIISEPKNKKNQWTFINISSFDKIGHTASYLH